MSTRKLIIAALLTGVAILVAGVLFLLQASTIDPDEVPDQLPAQLSTTTSAR